MSSNSEYVRVLGPLFDGRAEEIVQQMMVQCVETVSRVGLEDIRRAQGEAFKNPTGAYESTIHVESLAGMADVISDGGSVYGPWLEGVGSRNKTTRFKGYHIMRNVTQMLNRGQAKQTMQAVVRAAIARLNA